MLSYIGNCYIYKLSIPFSYCCKSLQLLHVLFYNNAIEFEFLLVAAGLINIWKYACTDVNCLKKSVQEWTVGIYISSTKRFHFPLHTLCYTIVSEIQNYNFCFSRRNGRSTSQNACDHSGKYCIFTLFGFASYDSLGNSGLENFGTHNNITFYWTIWLLVVIAGKP